MDGPMLIDHSGKIHASEMDSLLNMLWDQDMDMGVDRQFYDPALRETELKKQQAEQNRLQELKKKQAQQEMMYYTIDEETGERIPKPSAGPYQPPAEFTEDTDLSKDLAEIGEFANLDYLLSEGALEENQPKVDNSPVRQEQAPTLNDIIIQTADQPNPFSDLNMWPTEITMLSGSTQDNITDMGMPSATDGLDMDFMWQPDKAAAPTTSSNAGAYNVYNDTVGVHTQYQAYEQDKRQDMYKPTAHGNAYMADTFLDTFSTDSGEGSYVNEDVKPCYLLNQATSLTSGNGSSSSSSGYSGSENGDNSDMTKAEQERERRSICRDELKCKELGIPFSVEMITNYPVEEFNALLRMHRLSDEQLTVIKDIRRRGKNKVAAQNCRKKKLNELTGLEVEINDLKRKRTELVRDKDELKRSKLHLRKQLDQTYAEVFNSIRDHLGRPYDPHYYTLHISDDGDARIIPNKMSTYALLNYQQNA